MFLFSEDGRSSGEVRRIRTGAPNSPHCIVFFNPEPEKLIYQTNRVTLEKLSHIWTDLTHNNRCK